MSAISDDLKNKIRRDARNRCGYCLIPQEIVSMMFEIEHLQPIAAGGTDDEENPATTIQSLPAAQLKL